MVLEHDITIPDGWQTAWLDRTSSVFSWFRIIASLGQIVFTLQIFLNGRRYSRVNSLLNHHTGNHRPDRINEAKTIMDQTIDRQQTARRLSLILWHAQVILVFAADAVIAVLALNTDASSDSQSWNAETLIGTLSFITFYLGLSALAFFSTPAIALVATMLGVAEIESDGRTGLVEYLDSSMRFGVETANDCLPFWLSQVMFAWPPLKSPRWRIVAFATFYGYGVVTQYMHLATTYRENRLRKLRLREYSWARCVELLFATLNVADFGPQSETDRRVQSLANLEAFKPRIE